MKNAARLGVALAAAAVSLALPDTGRAQTIESPKEFGIDAGVLFGFGDLESTSISIPAQRLRIGFFRGPSYSFEPYLGLNYLKIDDFDATQINLGAGLLYHLSPDRTASQVFVRPFAELNYVGGDGDSETQFGIGAGLGVKVPWRERFATRWEAALGYAIEADDLPGGVTLNLGLGLSFFTPGS